MGAVVYILLGWLLTVAACYAAGALLLRRLTPGVWSCEETVGLRFVAGAGLYSMAVFALGIGHLYYRAVFVALPVGLAVWAWRTGALALPAERLPELPAVWRKLLWLMAPFTVLYLSNAMAPEASPDGAAYHLGLVAKYYRERAIVPVTTNMYAALSQGIEMLFLAAYAVGRHSAGALVHFTYLLALPWLILCYGRRYGMPGAGAAAALFVYCSPVVGIDGISAYNDVAAAAQWMALLLVLRRMEDAERSWRLPALAGMLGGFAYGMKYTLFPMLALAGVWVLWVYRREAWRPLVAMSAAALPFVAPWVVRNAIWWHNPLAPFFNNWFPNPFLQYSFEYEYRKHMARYSLESLAQIPLEVTVHGAALNGLLGPLFLLAPLGLLALRWPEGRRIVLAAAFALATYPSNIGTRFLIPALPFVALAMAQVLSQVRLLPVVLAVAHAVAGWPNVIPVYASQWAWRLEKVVWREALRIKPEEPFIIHHIPAYGIARKIDALVPAGRRVLGFGQVPEAYLSRDYLVSFQSAEGVGLRDIFLTPLDRDRQATRQLRLNVPSGRHRAVRVVQDREDRDGRFSITEMRVFNGAKEVERSPVWRLRAEPSPHEVQKAFDGSYLTRWVADGGPKPGQFIEIDFGQYEVFDRISLNMTADQPWDTYHIEVPDDTGGWTRLKTELQPAEVTTPVGMRRAAIEELLRRNVQYLVLSQDNFGYSDLILNRAVWGVEEIANVADIRLYRLIPASEFEAARKEGK